MTGDDRRPRAYAVGAPYLPGRTSWPDGTSLFSAGGYEAVATAEGGRWTDPVTPAEIRAVCADLNMPLAELARRLPVPLRTLEDWAAGRARPPAYLRRALADIERELSAVQEPQP